MEELGDLIKANPGLVHLRHQTGSGAYQFQPILSQDQMLLRKEHDMQAAMMLGDRIRDEPSISAEQLAKEMRRQGGSPRVMFIRPRTKKVLREAVRESPNDIFVEETSAFGNEFEGWLSDAPEQDSAVVGPDPRRQRSWFAIIRWSEKKGWIVD